MECLQCGRYAPLDRETGHDCDGLCPDCAHTADPAALAELSTRQDVATLATAITTATTRERLWELLHSVQALERFYAELSDRALRRLDTFTEETPDHDTPF